MDGKEDPSWLSSVIERVDQLALTIGGYEEKPREHGLFSDDESDTSDEDSASVDSGFEDAIDDNAGSGDDDEDSGFEDTVASPLRRTTDDQNKVASRAHPESPPSGDLQTRKEPPMAGADALPFLLVEQQRSPERVHVDSAEAMERSDRVQAPQEARQELLSEGAEAAIGMSTTPSLNASHFAEDDSPVLEGATLGEARSGSVRSPVYGTPAHSRDRSTYQRGPPIAASGAGSRRVHRGRNRTNESLATSSSEDIHGAAKAASVISSPSPSASHPYKKANGLPLGRAKKKAYSHVSDTTWLKRKEDLPNTTPSPPPPELWPDVRTAVPMAGAYCPGRAVAESTAEEGFLALDRPTALVDAAVVLPPSSSADGRNRHRFPKEMEHQLRQDVVKGYSQAETDSQVEKPSLRECAEDSQLEQRGVVGTEDDGADEAILAFSEDKHAASEVLIADFPVEQVHTNGQKEPTEENEEHVASRVRVDQDGGRPKEPYQDEALEEGPHESGPREDGEEISGDWNEGDATIGAKRASIGNNMNVHGLDWFLDSPEAFAPSKRGKMHPKYSLAVMRHSARLDDAIHERERKLGAMTAGGTSTESIAEEGGNDGSKGLENDDELAAVPWPDRAQRPYDSPIVDTDLPARQAKELCRLGMDSQTLIVCSPFRRCLQTAGVVARTLGVAGVTVHLEVGERMDKVRKEIAELALANDDESERASGSRQPAPVFSYLKEADMRGALGAGVRLERIVGEQPPEGESGVEAKQRFIATIAKVREEQLCDRPVLIVAHGDTLDAAGESLASQIVFEADYCAWALFELDSHCGHVTESYGIQMIPL